MGCWNQRLNRFGAGTSLMVGLLVVALACPGRTQETSPAEAPSAMTAGDPLISLDHLRLRLKPLTLEELQVEANAWRDLLKAKVAEIAEVRIAASSDVAEQTPEDSAAPTSETLATLQDEKTELVTRLGIVLDELELKGGEVEAYQMYIRAQTGVAIDVTDTQTLWTIARSWLTSEQGGQRWGWNLGKFLVILIGFYLAARFVASIARHAVSRVRGVSQLLVHFVERFVRQLVIVIGLIVALAALEVNITPLLAAVGAAGFVIAFALQDTLSNFASGMLILAYRPFDVGHVIDAAGVSGIVDSVDLFSTHVRTFDNKMMIVPNNDIWGGTITNATASKTRRVDMVFGVGYEDDLKKAKETLERLVSQHPLVLADPAPTIKLNELGESSINFICRPWSKTEDYWTVYWDLTEQVKEAFDQEGISIPFPQRDVHLYQQTTTT